MDYYNFCSLEILSYDFSSNEWDPLPQIPLSFHDFCPQQDFKLVLHDNSIYLLGGSAEN